jgi:hypothetical protein
VAVAVTIAELREHDGLLSVTEVAAIIGLDPETIRRASGAASCRRRSPRADPDRSAGVLAWLQETRRRRSRARAGARAAGSAIVFRWEREVARRTPPGERGSFRERVRRSRSQ